MKNRNLLGVLSICLLLSGCSSGSAVKVEETDSGLNIYNTTNTIKNTAHVNETTYDNATLDAELFEIPFRTNEDANYVSNKEFLSSIEESETAKDISSYLETAEKAVLLTFAQNGNDIEEETYTSSIETLYAASNAIYVNGSSYGPEEYAKHLYQLYSDNKIHVDGKFITDKSLIWQNNYMYYVRGTVELTLEDDVGEAYSKEFHLPLNKTSQNIKLIVQVKFMSGNHNQIIGIDILGMI